MNWWIYMQSYKLNYSYHYYYSAHQSYSKQNRYVKYDIASSPSVLFLSIEIFAKHRTVSWYASGTVNKRHITERTRSCTLTSDIFYQWMINFIDSHARTVYSENSPAHVSPTVIAHMSIPVLTQITFAASMNNFIVGMWKLSKYALVGLRCDSSKYSM